MPEYFVVANSSTAPLFSDTSMEYIDGESPEHALLSFAARYSHPFGLFSAALYQSADDYHKGRKPLARWLRNDETKIRAADPKGGRLIPP